MKKKICFRCHRFIDDKSNYYAFTEFDNEKEIKTDYAHRTCWDNFLKSLSNTSEAMGLMRGLKSKMRDMGLLSDEVVEVA